MITIYEEPLRENPDVFMLTGYETKENLYELLKIVGHPLPKSKSKAEFRCQVANVFEADPCWYINAIPQEEQGLLVQLLQKKQDEYIEWPRDDYHYLVIQKIMLVVTCEHKDKWHLYMSDYVRDHINRRLKEELASNEKAQSLDKLISRSNQTRQAVMKLLTENDPNTINASQRRIVAQKASALMADLKAQRKDFIDYQTQGFVPQFGYDRIFEEYDSLIILLGVASSNSN